MSVPETPTGASPYATGGGGTVLEHRYGATLLGNLLTGDPVPELGDDVTPISVRFQASAFSPVDDLLVVGRTPDGGERRLSIGVRRAPLLVSSDEASAQLLQSYVRVVAEHWDDVRSGQWRLGLAVASPNAAVQQVRELAVIARGVADESSFRTKVARPRVTNRAVRERLVHVDALVNTACQTSGVNANVDAGVLSWRLLFAVGLPELRLEGADESDRTHAVTRLRTVIPDGTLAGADQLFSRLAELVGRYAPAGAEITEPLLRRDLSGMPLARSPSRVQAWTILDGLAARLGERTGFRLADSETHLELERAEARKDLVLKMTTAATGPAALVVVGEPDVGKSAITLRASEQIVAAGTAVTTMSLRDLPATILEFEGLLGGRLGDVFGSTAIGRGRLLVVDGAESVLEGRDSMLTDLASAALRAGLGVVAVTRTDGVGAVAEALKRAISSYESNATTEEFPLSRLTPTEAKELTATFPSLARLDEDPRSAWLLGRPGLVDILLRAGPAIELPRGPLSEADVFAAFWWHVVRQMEKTGPGSATPDGRDRALTSLAHQLLVPTSSGSPPDPTALPSLRSDGLLLPPGPTSAWNPGDQFASDLVRDMSVARLLITHGWGVLDEARAPRWALRAVRLACQATLANAGDGTEEVRITLQEAFDKLAARYGIRWAEVPLEAILTLGSARAALMRAWPALIADERAGLSTLLRLALQRYSEGGFGDPVILAPLVELAYCGEHDLGQDNRHARHGTGQQIRQLVLEWLRGLAKADAGPLLLRQQVRDHLLATDREQYDEFAVEALGMLGPDLDERAEGFLRGLAESGGAFLAPAVESVGAILAMSTHQPGLLIDLAEAFYIIRRDEDPEGWSSGFFDDGIRHHRPGRGIGVPMAAWYFGPFFRLLNVRLRETVALTNRMLDHAAAARVRQLGGLGNVRFPPGAPLPGLDLEFPGVGVRRCVGDEHVWSWYRRSSVGPHACMSALLAIERFADHLIDGLGVPLANVAALLLRDCNNLAMPGLVVGLLVRHLDNAGDQLDRWLAQPEVWNLEFYRAVSEDQLHVPGDPAELVGGERRRFTFRDVAAQMTVTMKLAGNQDRLAALAAVGDQLIKRARDQVAAGQSEESGLIEVEGWAAALHPENYRARRTDDGDLLVEFEAPENVATGLAPSLASLNRRNEMMRLQLAYAMSEERISPVDTLLDDLAIARGFHQSNALEDFFRPADPIAAVAAAAVVAHGQGRLRVPDDDLRWAAEVLIEAAIPEVDALSHESSTYPMGADRSAAAALPSLLLPPFDGIGLDRLAISLALGHCAGSLFDEVRTAFAGGLAPVWVAACEPAACRHEIAWRAVLEGLRDCQLGDWDPTGQERSIEMLDGPYELSLLTVETERLLVNRLTAPLVATSAAAHSDSCVADAAKRLLDVLFDAHRRGSDNWAKKGYDAPSDIQRRKTVRVLVEAAAAGDARALTEHVRVFTSNARALDQLLRDVAVLFTYDDTLRPALPAVWRGMFTVVLDALQGGVSLGGDDFWSDSAIAGMLPTPQMDIIDRDPEATFGKARQNWISPDDIADLVARWLPLARHKPRAVDALVDLAKCATTSWQATTGLAWVEDLVNNDYAAVASKCWLLPDWLEAVHASVRLDSDGSARWQRLVDGLAAEGDTRAVNLQKARE